MNTPCESDLSVQGMLVNSHFHVSLTSRNIIFLPLSLLLSVSDTHTDRRSPTTTPYVYRCLSLSPSGGNDGFLHLARVCPLVFKRGLELPIIIRFYSRQLPLTRPPQNFLHNDGIPFLSFSCLRNSHGGWKCIFIKVSYREVVRRNRGAI